MGGGGEMRVLRPLLVTTLCAGVIATTAATAAADPTQAPGSESVTFTCGGVPVTLTVLPNGSAAAFTSSTSVGIAVGNGSQVNARLRPQRHTDHRVHHHAGRPDHLGHCVFHAP